MYKLTVVSVLLLASLAPAGELEVKKNPVPADSFAVVKYKLAKDDKVAWKVYPEPTEVERVVTADYAYLYFNGPANKYSVDATIVNFETRDITQKTEYVTIGVKPPVPPVPPIPPVPPVPPTDTLLKVIQELYDKDTSPTKDDDRKALAAVYSVLSDSLGSINTNTELFKVGNSAINARIAGRLKPIRSAFGVELEKVLPVTVDAMLVDKIKVSDVLKKFATVLENVK